MTGGDVLGLVAGGVLVYIGYRLLHGVTQTAAGGIPGVTVATSGASAAVVKAVDQVAAAQAAMTKAKVTLAGNDVVPGLPVQALRAFAMSHYGV